MPNFRIQGGRKLSGTVKTCSSKNATLPLLAASLMTNNKTVLHDVPRIQEVFRFEEIFKSLGVKWTWTKDHVVEIIPPKRLKFSEIHYEAAAKTRSIIYLLGALMHQYKKFSIPRSGGCKLGKRTVSPHMHALESFGASIKTTQKYYEFSCKGPSQGNYLVMSESGDTPTNNAIMAAVLSQGKTTIKMASANYMVQELCHFLNAMGAKIKGIGTTTLEIQGVKKLKGVEYSIMPDPIESMFWFSLAACTGSSLRINACPRDFIELELLLLENMGFSYEVVRKYKSKSGRFDLLDIKTFPSKLVAHDEKISCRPFPGLNMDNLPFFVPVAALAKGRSLIHDWCYENRAIYFIELQKLGADISLLDPHRVLIIGPSKLTANELVCPPALRPATILIIAMLVAKGTSIIRNTYPIDRGYENLYERLRKLGAEIEEINV